jgi:hypothetical protein
MEKQDLTPAVDKVIPSPFTKLFFDDIFDEGKIIN